MVKFLGCILVLACSAALGTAGARDLKRHCAELHGLKQAIYMLRGEIQYSRSPLPDVFAILAERAAPPFSCFFGNLERELDRQEGRSLKEIWECEMAHSLKGSTLKQAEKQSLKQLGDGLGYLDLEMQLATIELYLEQLNEAIAAASGELEEKQKLYRSLGIAGGVFLVIFLV